MTKRFEQEDSALKAYRKRLHEQPNHAVLDESGNVMPISVYDEEGELIESMLIQWAAWFEKNKQRKIGYTEIDNYLVSTIFNGLNLNYGHFGPPKWFETMVFEPPHLQEWFDGETVWLRTSIWCQRTRNLKEAIAAHDEGVVWLKDHLADKPASSGH